MNVSNNTLICGQKLFSSRNGLKWRENWPNLFFDTIGGTMCSCFSCYWQFGLNVGRSHFPFAFVKEEHKQGKGKEVQS